MREIVLDTETTGLDPKSGHRLVEIGGIELLNHIPTGNRFHRYINPERDMPEDARAIHGLGIDFLSKHPPFRDICSAFLDFIADARLVIHNAGFDMAFINHEIAAFGHAAISNSLVLDTLALARRKHPGQQNSLDALCARYGIDNSRRDLHGALLDAELLAEVYIELIGGRQAALGLREAETGQTIQTATKGTPEGRPEPLPSRLTEADKSAHWAFVKKLGGPPVWAAYDSRYANSEDDREA